MNSMKVSFELSVPVSDIFVSKSSVFFLLFLAIQMIDKLHARIRKLSFAMRWNKLNYAQMHLLNHTTIINWTVGD